MKIKEDFILKTVAGNNIVISTGSHRKEFHGIMTFNDVGAEVFNLLDGTRSVEEIISKISEEYDAPYETVKADVTRLIDKMKNHGLIED